MLSLNYLMEFNKLNMVMVTKLKRTQNCQIYKLIKGRCEN